MTTLVSHCGWAVYSDKGRVCINEECMPAVFTHRKRAVEFRKALVPHIGKCRVIRVRIRVSGIGVEYFAKKGGAS